MGIAALASTKVTPFGVDYLSRSINLFYVPCRSQWFPQPAGQPLALADGRIANSMLMAVIVVLFLQRHLVCGIALTSFGGR